MPFFSEDPRFGLVSEGPKGPQPAPSGAGVHGLSVGLGGGGPSLPAPVGGRDLGAEALQGSGTFGTEGPSREERHFFVASPPQGKFMGVIFFIFIGGTEQSDRRGMPSDVHAFRLAYKGYSCVEGTQFEERERERPIFAFQVPACFLCFFLWAMSETPVCCSSPLPNHMGEPRLFGFGHCFVAGLKTRSLVGMAEKTQGSTHLEKDGPEGIDLLTFGASLALV